MRQTTGPKLIELLGYIRSPASLQTELWGLHLAAVGLDAGLDAHALAPHALGRFGVGLPAGSGEP